MRSHLRVIAGLVAVVLAGILPLTVAADGATVKGRLVDADSGGGAAGVTIQVCAADGCVGSVGQSDANGYYTITGAPAGSVWALVTFPTASCGPSEYARAHAVVAIPASGTVTAPDIVLSKQKGAIGGKVRDGSGRPVAGAQVIAENSEQGGDGFNYAASGSDGSYLIGCLPAGRGYFLTTNGPKGGPYGQQVDSMFTVSSGQVLGHDITLSSAGGSISGTVTCGGQPCQGVNLLVQRNCDNASGSRQGCSVASLQSSPGGGFRASNLAAGSYVIHAFPPAGFDAAARFDVKVGDGQAVGAVDIELVPNGPGMSGRVVGRVTSGGAGVAGCRLNVFNTLPPSPPLAQGLASDVHADEAGNYDTGWTLTPGGLYRVYADCPGRDEIVMDADVVGGHISLTAGRTETVNLSFGNTPSSSDGGGPTAPKTDETPSPGSSPSPGAALAVRTVSRSGHITGGSRLSGFVRHNWPWSLLALPMLGGLTFVGVRRFRFRRRSWERPTGQS